jgi:hypothetical protein
MNIYLLINDNKATIDLLYPYETFKNLPEPERFCAAAAHFRGGVSRWTVLFNRLIKWTIIGLMRMQTRLRRFTLFNRNHYP